jgi:4-amino-4-deoxy-L-arabinose transferase-like glycosyltransferase
MKKPGLELSGALPGLDSRRNLRVLRSISWGIAIVAGFLQAWAARFTTTPDGTCYLDIAAAYLRGDWHNAVNSYWSPLFSWLLALGMWTFHPNPYWESTLLHMVNLAGMLTALVSFEFFFRSLVKHGKDLGVTEDGEHALPEFVWWTLGYGLFLSTTLFLLPGTDTSPDIWVSAFTYIVAGLILRLRAAGSGWRLFALLGFTLAIAYLTKTFYFPITFVFLPAAWIATRNLRKTAKQAAFALVIFFLVAGPWIFVLSRSRHRVTFGDAGKLAIDTVVDQSWQRFFWQGENGSGVPKHPVRQLLTHPRVFEFATPIAGTYPPAFDEPYWTEGVRLRLNFRGPLIVFRQSFGTFFQIWQIQVEYAVLLLALFIAAASRAAWWDLFRQQAYLWVPPLVACASYAIVLIEFRYVAPFVLLLWLATISSFLSLRSEGPRRFLFAVILATFCVTGLKIAKFAVSDLLAIRANHENADWQVAQGLRNWGLQPGDSVAGLSRVAESQWARLAGVKIVAEIPLGEENVFWTADQETKQKVFRLLACTGAKMVITKNPPPGAHNEAWIRFGETSFYGYPLPRPGLLPERFPLHECKE